MGNKLLNPSYEFEVKIFPGINFNVNSGLMDWQCSDDSKKVNPISLCRVWVKLDINQGLVKGAILCSRNPYFYFQYGESTSTASQLNSQPAKKVRI